MSQLKDSVLPGFSFFTGASCPCRFQPLVTRFARTLVHTLAHTLAHTLGRWCGVWKGRAGGAESGGCNGGGEAIPEGGTKGRLLHAIRGNVPL
eukprot:2831431-Pyramimonas_sp.AAC.2